MLETSARLLRLLSLLQARREWSGADLADRLGVTPRTVRRDVDRLRGLGYPVDASPGTGGGYRMGSRRRAPAAAPRRRRGRRRRRRSAHLGGPGRRGHRRDIRTGPVQARTGPPRPAPPPRVRPQRVHRADAPRPGSLRRRPVRPDRTRRRLPGLGAAALRLRGPRGRRHAPHRRAAPPGVQRAPLVPGRLGRRPGGLAHVPRRPHHAEAAARAALHPAHATRRRPRRVRLQGCLAGPVRPRGDDPAPGARRGGGTADQPVGGHARGRRRRQVRAAHRGGEPRCDGDPRDPDGLRVRGARTRRAHGRDQVSSGPSVPGTGTGLPADGPRRTPDGADRTPGTRSGPGAA